MRIARKYVNQPLSPDTVARLEDSAAHYLARVLRLRPGDAVVLFNGDGHDYAGEALDPRCREVGVRARVPAKSESPLSLTLAQAIGKGDRMDYALQKATELGASAFQPLFTQRTEVRLDERRLARRMAHWHGVVAAACEQCGRAVVPELRPALTLDDYLALPATSPRWVLDPEADTALVSLNDPIAGDVVVGPEGGWSEREVKALALSGATPVRFGPRILRTETAGPAAIAVLQALFGDLA